MRLDPSVRHELAASPTRGRNRSYYECEASTRSTRRAARAVNANTVTSLNLPGTGALAM